MLRHHIQRALIAGLGLLAAMSIAVFYLDQQTGQAATAARENITRTYVVERAFEGVHTVLAEADSAQRGYLLTGDPADLRGFQQTRQRATAAIQRIRDLALASTPHHERVERLTSLATTTLDSLDKTVTLAFDGRRDEAMQMLKAREAEHPIDQVRILASAARTAELGFLAERQRSFNNAIDRRRMLRRVLLSTSLVLTMAAFYFALRLRRLESFVTMCAWSRTIQLDGRWVTFEEYLAQRFDVHVSHGIAPRELDKLMVQIKKAEDEDPSGPIEGVPKKSAAA